MATTPDLGIYYPEGTDDHPSALWWQQNALTVEAAIKQAAADGGSAYIKGDLAGADLDAMLEPGVWRIKSGGLPGTIGLPPTEVEYPVGFLTVTNIEGETATWAAQSYAVHGASPELWWRITANTTPTWNPWVRLSPSIAAEVNAEVTAGMYRHTALRGRFLRRRGGRIGTGGKGAVALRFDHHLDDFVPNVLPHLTARRLPWAQALNSARVGTGIADDNYTWAQVHDMCVNTGGEIWNHSRTHQDASGDAAQYSEIVTGLQEIQAGLPTLAIEGWVTPGVTGTYYDGANPYTTLEQIAESYSGQLIAGHHALFDGYSEGGPFRTLDPNAEQFAATHTTIDKQTPAQVMAYVDQAIERREGIVLMLHPSLLDAQDAMTTADFEQVLDYIVAKRDTDELAVLSLSGMHAADLHSDFRHDLVDVPVASTAVAGGSTFTQSAGVLRKSGHLGSTREVVVEFDAAAATTASVVVGARPAVEVPVPAGVSAQRVPVTVPTDSGNISVQVTPAAAVTIDRVRVLAV